MTGNRVELIFQSMFMEHPMPKDARNRNIGVKLS